MNNDDDVSSGWLVALSTRSALRAVTLCIGLTVCYLAVAALGKHHFDPAVAHADGLRALLTFASLDGLLVVFALCHAYMPSEVSELNARITSRGVMRWLAMASCFGCALVGQVAAWWYHDSAMAFGSTAVSGLVWLFFAWVYGVYANMAHNDRIAPKRSICVNGTARDALIKMAASTCLGFLLCGLAAVNDVARPGGIANDVALLDGIVCCLGAAIVFALANGIFVNTVDLDYDRG